MARHDEIQRRLNEGRGVREIARALKVSRVTVRDIRDGSTPTPAVRRTRAADPLWMGQVPWPGVIEDLRRGHALKLIWDEKAKTLTSYPNFWKQFYRKFPEYRAASVTAREFAAGERVEVDWAGDAIEWVDLKTGALHKAWVFVSGLGFSQLLFAWATPDMKSMHWLGCHQRMFEFYGGVPHVTVPDCLKQGVIKCHIYDPDLNPEYAQLATHFGTSIVPARPATPKDKAIAEGLVKILCRYVRFRYRKHHFTSIGEINRALIECVEKINNRVHTRFRISRRERFESIERAALKALPVIPYEVGEWKRATLHPDCYIGIDSAYYSAPHIHRGKELRVKLTETQVEIYLDLECLAIHPRDRRRAGYRTKIDAHFPPQSQAYYEATPQNLLSQARFIDESLHQLVVELFNAEVYGNIRRVQGLVRTCHKEIREVGREAAITHLRSAMATMRQYEKFRVSYLQDLLKQARLKKGQPTAEREIERIPGNPMLRHKQAAAGEDCK